MGTQGGGIGERPNTYFWVSASCLFSSKKSSSLLSVSTDRSSPISSDPCPAPAPPDTQRRATASTSNFSSRAKFASHFFKASPPPGSSIKSRAAAEQRTRSVDSKSNSPSLRTTDSFSKGVESRNVSREEHHSRVLIVPGSVVGSGVGSVGCKTRSVCSVGSTASSSVVLTVSCSVVCDVSSHAFASFRCIAKG